MVVVLVGIKLTVPLVAVGVLDLGLSEDDSAVLEVLEAGWGNRVVKGIRAAIVSPPFLHRPDIRAARSISTIRVSGGKGGTRKRKLEGSLEVALLGSLLQFVLEVADDNFGLFLAATVATWMVVMLIFSLGGEETGKERDQSSEKVHLL